jgi:hypothetical protein
MTEWMNEWTDEWIDELTNEWINEWTDEWMNECKNEWTNIRHHIPQPRKWERMGVFWKKVTWNVMWTGVTISKH